MFGLSRTSRLFLLVFVVVIIASLYLLHPSAPNPFTKQDAVRVEAGGIDSPHWRDPISPQVALEDDAEEDQEDDAPRIEEEEVRDLEVPLSYETGPSTGETVSKVVKVEEAVPGVIMPKMTNATAKAELGRSAWRVLHLMTLRYPEKPTQDERDALKSYFHLFAKLYPCGECAAEFQALLKEYPPQTSSRKTASMWLCFVHNLVNERLGKPEFDCLTLDETYDCGCGPDGETSSAASPTHTTGAYGED